MSSRPALRHGVALLIAASLAPACASKTTSSSTEASASTAAPDPRVAALEPRCAEVRSTFGQGDPGPMPDVTDPLQAIDALWARRGTRQGLVDALAVFEKAAAQHPNDGRLLVHLSRGYFLLGDGYTDDIDAKMALYAQGMEWGSKAMKATQGFRAWEEKVGPDEAVTGASEIDIAAAYWYATNLGKWARAKGFGTVVAKKNEIARILTWVKGADERFYHGAPRRYWGGFYAVAPAFAGGDLAKSKENFDKAIAIAPNMFSSYVLYADTYATKAQDKDLFLRNLETVITGDVAAIPELVPEQTIEKRKACDFLARTAELFGE